MAPEVIYELTTAAEQEEASLVQSWSPSTRCSQRSYLGRRRLSRLPIRATQAELEAWTTTDLHRTDGVPVYAIPRGMPVPSQTFPAGSLTLLEGDGCRR